jgi:hypothetical protein
MIRWRFRTYVSSSGRNDVQDCVDALEVDAQVKFAVELKYLAVSLPTEWHEPRARKLRGHEGLFEIRFKAGKVQQRPIGFFGPGPAEFTILVWATHKQNVYQPAKALATADARRKAVLGGTALTAPLTIDGEDVPPDEESESASGLR